MAKKNLIVSIVIFLKEISEEGLKVWVQTRDEEGPLFGMLEFPGGKIEPGESPVEAARREVMEEVEISVPKDSPLLLFKLQEYSYDNKNICLFVFISPFDQLPRAKGEWLTLTYAQGSAPFKGKIPPINHEILDTLLGHVQKQFNAGQMNSLWQMGSLSKIL